MEASATLPAPAQRTVENLMSVRYGTRVRIAAVKDFPYSQVSRCWLEANGGDSPLRVIVRVPWDDSARLRQARLHNEQAAFEFLSSIGSTLARAS